MATGHHGPVVVDAHPPVETQFGDRLLQRPGPALHGVEEHPGRRLPPQRQRQAGQAGPAAQVEAPGRARVADGLGQVVGVADLVLDGGRPEEAELLGPAQGQDEGVAQLGAPSGTITTRR